MNKSIFLPITIIGVFLLFASCNDNRKASYYDHKQDNKEFSVSDSDFIKQNTVKDTILSLGKNSTPQKRRNEQGRIANLQDFRKRTVSKYFAGTITDSLSVGRAELKVPHGSMERAKVLSITPLRKGELPHLPAGMVNVTADRSNPTVETNSKDSIAGYRFLPHGEHFVYSPASIAVPYDSTLIPQGYTAEDIHTYYYDELKAQWVMLRHKALDKGKELVMAETSHFTDIINGIIKVPESPETQNYVPTGISELKAAVPNAGITTVSAPTANQSGTASLGYSFDLPKGRADMQPSVGLQYSSDGSSSYVGYGWNLPLQSIDIETRWGVPRFDTDKESESYLFMGSKLSDRTYRTSDAPARSKDKRFYPLVEGGFAKIIRKGDSPQNYTWEVTTKDGTVSYFGGVDGTVDDNAVLKDGNGNILRWALCKTQDTHDNFVSYKYIKRGNNLYPDTYRYTGSKSEDGAYSVRFAFKSEARKDVVKSGRLGILQTDDALLDRVEVKYNSELLRAYALRYKEGVFSKTLLDSIVQLDSKDRRVAAQGFSYFDETKNGIFSSEEETWNSKSKEEKFVFFKKKRFDNVSDSLSILGSSSSSGGSGGGGFGVAIGPVSVGASYELSKNKSYGEVTFWDIDGDGLPDKIFKNSTGIWYRPNLYGKTAQGGFGDPIHVKGIGRFSESESLNHNVGVDVGAGFGPASVGASYGHSIQSDKVNVYMQDFNGDGLVDIANKGTVYFNHIGADGKPYFEPTSAGTFNPIHTPDEQVVDQTFIPDYKQVRDSLEQEFPLNDAVRVWRAPYTGTVTISGLVERTATHGDGVKMNIQTQGVILWKDSLIESGTRNYALTRNVVAGQHVFFRLQSRYSGIADSIKWDPAIQYTTISSGVTTYAGEDLTQYKASRDYIGGEVSTAYLTETGKVLIKAPYHKEKTSDDVYLRIIKQTRTSNTTQAEIHLKADTIVDGVFETEYLANKADSAMLKFVIETKSPIDWKKVTWKPIYYYENKDTIALSPARTIFAKHVLPIPAQLFSPLIASTLPAYGTGFRLVPYLKVDRHSASDKESKVFLTIKSTAGDLIHSTDFTLAPDGHIKRDTLIFTDAALATKLANRSFYVTFSSERELTKVDTACIKIIRTGFEQEIKASVFSKYDSNDYGLLYKGWGQFAYNGNKEWGELPIDTTVLKIDQNKYKDIASDDPDPEQIGQVMTPINKERFFMMGYNVQRDVYVSVTDSTYIGRVSQCSSRIGQQEIDVDSVSYAAGGSSLPAPVLKTEASGNTVSASGKFAVKFLKAGLSGSKSWQNSYTNVSCMDINGDGYPDWIKERKEEIKAQITTQAGALSNHIFEPNVANPKFKASSGTVGIDIGADLKDGGNAGDGRAESPTIAEQWSFSKKSLIAAAKANETSSGSVSASGNYTSGKTSTERDWTDLNGDGLPDMLDGGSVRYNLGNSFADAQESGCGGIGTSKSKTWGAGGGVSIPIAGKVNISFGFNGTRTTSESTSSMNDLNGDGLPDIITLEGNDLYVAYNTGNGFLPKIKFIKNAALAKSVSSSVSGFANVGVAIPALFVTLLPRAIASKSDGVSRNSTALIDIDGDGYPDYVRENGPNELKVRRNLTGRTNLLKDVTLPFGGHIALTYEKTLPGFALPGSRYVLKSVETTGGYAENGATKMRNEFEYEGGYRDRRERDFYGFEKVITKQIDTQNGNAVYRKQVEEYGHNRDFYMHDLLTAETLYDTEGNKLQGTQNTYELKQQTDTTVYFPALVSVKQTIYDNNGSGSMSTTVNNTYDAYGNLISYKETATNYELDADIAYHDLQAKYIVSVPKHIAVKDKAGKVCRERSTNINGLGDITGIMMHNGDKPSVYDMTYDAYGNLTSLTKPENHNGQRMRYDYTYDGVLHMLVTNVKDAYGYSSSTAYDYKWAVPVETSDLNGNKMRYTYDDMGRPSTILGPKEIVASKPYTIKFEYHPAARYARTLHYAPEGDIETYTFADSLMRTVQTKQTGVVWTGGSNQKVSVVSGRAVVDAFGRTIKAFYPMTESYGSIGTYNTATGDPQVTTEYDVYDRTTKVTLPDGATTTTAYGIVSHDGEPMLETKVTDALGRNAESYTDEKGRNRETVQHASGDNITVKYDYDAVGQVTTVHHPNDKTTTYEYDLLGQKLKVNHPDAGEVTCTYDAAGNLLTKLTAELKKRISADAPITYTYDYERLSEVLYPKNLFNRVTYTYGKPGEKYNRAGRLVLVEDASGGEAYYYGNQGEVVKTVRSVMVSTADVRTYVYGATYDSWNRVRTMTYPDGEVVTYAYNAAGQIESIKSDKQGKEETIVEKVGYDKDGHTVYTKLGNGTETTYTYDKQRERLQEMNLMAAGTAIMTNKYQYDAVDNILGITNAIDPTQADNGNSNNAKLGGAFNHTYAYDDLNRLIKANGKAKNASYEMTMTFGRMSEPLTKVQKVDSTKTAQSYDFTYKYEDNNHPTAPTQIGHEHYTYDANGNPTLVENDSLNTERRMYWDEENRLMVLSDNGKTSRYTYNATGERIIKSHGDLEGVYVNGAPQGITFHETEDYTIYPAPIITVTKNRFTKHYFIGDKRIASKLGTGKFNNVYGISGNNVTAGQKDYAARMLEIEKQREEYYKSLGTPPGVPTMKGATADPDNTGRGYNDIIINLGDHSVPEGWVQRPKFNDKGDVPGPPIQWKKPEDPDNAQPGYGYISTDTTNVEDIFFYHSDHLGSTSYITDAKANITQFDAYLPYGELLVDEHSSSEDMPYKFNGKELDQETGLYYYEARYLNPVTSLWMSVDSKTSKMPSWSPYSAFFNNSIRFIDPDGKEPTPAEAARIAAHVYGDKKDNILIGGWRVSHRDFGIKLTDETSLRSLVYERVVDGKVTEYVYATAGSVELRDWAENIKQPLGLSKQYENAAKNAKKLSKTLGNTELNFVGHSLGGGEAALNSLITSDDKLKGRKAFTFNAAGVSDITKFSEGTWKTPLKSEGKIEAYILRTDPLNILQNSSPVMPDVNGNRHYLYPKDVPSVYNGHSIDNIIKNFGVNPDYYKK